MKKRISVPKGNPAFKGAISHLQQRNYDQVYAEVRNNLAKRIKGEDHLETLLSCPIFSHDEKETETVLERCARSFMIMAYGIETLPVPITLNLKVAARNGVSPKDMSRILRKLNSAWKGMARFKITGTPSIRATDSETTLHFEFR